MSIKNEKNPYWDIETINDIKKNNWAVENLNKKINLVEWAKYLDNLPKDHYVKERWKRMSWLYLENNRVSLLKDCPMAQGMNYNDAETMAEKLRNYAEIENDFFAREDVNEFILSWADLWGIKEKEPILIQINDVKGSQMIDPLQGQGIHKDGSHFLSVLVLNE